MSKPELKPCPFCGGKAVVNVNDGVKVVCTECGARTLELVDGYSQGRPTGDAVWSTIEKWNRRADNE